MEKTRIIINRKSSFVGSAVKFKVEFNGNKVGEIANGKSIEIETIEGEHKLKISFGKKITEAIIMVSGDDVITLNTKINVNTSKVDIYSNDNKLINTKIDKHTTNISSVPKKNKKTINCKTCGAEISPRAKRCPNCGEMTPGELVSQTAIGCITAPFIAIVILIAIAFYFGFFGGLLK